MTDLENKEAFMAWFKKEYLGIDDLANQGDEGAITRRDYAYVGWQAKAQKAAVSECIWIPCYDGSVFNTNCGHTFELSNSDSLADNKMKHCCFCGGLIEVQE